MLSETDRRLLFYFLSGILLPMLLPKPFFLQSVYLSKCFSVGPLVPKKGCLSSVFWTLIWMGPLTKGDEKVSSVQSADGEIESFRVGKAHLGIAPFPLNCGLERFRDLLSEVCVCVRLSVCMSIHVFVWASRFPCVCICARLYVSLEWETVQSTYCSLCQRVGKLSLSGRRCASAGSLSIVSAAPACSPPLGVIQRRAVVHIQTWSFKPGGNHVSSREAPAVIWSSVSEHLSVTFRKSLIWLFSMYLRKAFSNVMHLADVPSGYRFSAKLSALQPLHFSVLNILKDVLNGLFHWLIDWSYFLFVSVGPHSWRGTSTETECQCCPLYGESSWNTKWVD